MHSYKHYKQLTPRKKAVAVALASMGYSTTEINKNSFYSIYSTSSRLLTKLGESVSTNRLFGPGRPKLSNIRQVRVIEKLCITNRMTSSTDLRRDWSSVCDWGSVLERCEDFSVGLRARRPLRKPIQTKSRVSQRNDDSRNNLLDSGDKRYVLLVHKSTINFLTCYRIVSFYSHSDIMQCILLQWNCS